MKVIQIFSNLVDVFTGNEWEQWSRWRNSGGIWNQVGGNKVKNPDLIINTIKGKKNGT